MLFRSILFALAVVALAPAVSFADEPGPIAIRLWKDGGMTIESHWGYRFGSNVSADVSSELLKPLDVNLSELAFGGQSILRRVPNESTASLVAAGTSEPTSYDAMVGRANILVGDADPGNSVAMFVLDVGDQMVFVYNETPAADCLKAVASKEAKAQLKSLADEMMNQYVVVATHESWDQAACESLLKLMQPRLLVVRSGVEKVGDIAVEAVAHNTLAVSKTTMKGKGTRIVSLGVEPYKMSDKVKELFARKEASCSASRDMFAKLSVEQMNFKPADGSHTPRWNAEHMMGRELLFFSQIYNAVDPSIPVMDLNPKQMPKDYKFAHADWDGAEEARQMQRVEDFTRRFAYMLDGMQLDRKAKGSRFWSPSALLKQMERHYNEHSANVVKKMKLDGWPSSKE